MLQFFTSWPVLLVLTWLLILFALMVEPAIPARPDGSFTEVAELTF
jgi:hypothetical protein